MAQGSLRKRGNSWYYRFDAATKDGQRQQIEQYGGKTKLEAEKKLRRAIQDYETSGRFFKATSMSAHDYFNYWFDQYVMKELKYNTQLNYRNIIDKYIEPSIGKFRLQAITPAAIQHLVDNLPTDKLAKHTVEIIVTVIKKAFKMAVFPYQYIKEDPALYIMMPRYAEDSEELYRKSREHLKIITMSQFEQIVSLTPPFSPFYMPLMISFNTGMRRGEVAGLEWDAVDFDERRILVKQQMIQHEKGRWELATPKTKKSYRSIEIGDQLVRILREQRHRQSENRLKYGKYYTDTNFVCTHENGKPCTPNSIKYEADKISKEVSFPFNFHSLRHTHATILLENGADYKQIQARLGHSRIATTMDTYAHATREKQRETANIFDNIFSNSSHNA